MLPRSEFDRFYDYDLGAQEAAGPAQGGVAPGEAPAPAPEQSWYDQIMGKAEAGGGGGGGGGGVPGDPSALFQIRGAPAFRAPRFQAPTAAGLEADPGYQFRLGSGREALERSAAARGVLRTGGTLKDLLEYGQKFGSQEYEGAYNRALQAHDREAAAAKSEYDPLFAQWQAQTGADQTKGQLEYGRLYGGGGGGGGGGEDIAPPPQYYAGE